MKLAFIGTGIMGAPMVRRLIRGGHSVRVYNRSPSKAQALAADGAIVCTGAAEAANGVEVVFTMVPDSPDLEQVLAQLLPTLADGQLVIDMSTVAPAVARAAALKLEPLAVDFLDAPVSGGEPGAIEGTLTIMVGGKAEAFERAKPLLSILGKRITHMGTSGSGQMTKLANQVAVALTLEATAEALSFARLGGLDPGKVLEALGAGAAGSWQLSNLGPKIVARDWRPGFFISLMRKDLRLVHEAARETQSALPALAVVTAMFNAAAALGHDKDGTQALASALEALAGGTDKRSR